MATDSATQNLKKSQEEARRSADALLNKINQQHEDIQRRMNDELRFLTTTDQRKLERAELISSYFPEYGRKSGFKEGLISGGAALVGGLVGMKIPGLSGFTRASAAAAGASFGYIASDSIMGERSGREDSISGLQHQENLRKYGPMATYTARSDWQSGINIMGPEAFELEVARPGGEIARAWNLNPKQFVPGAMDLLSSGLISSPSAEKGRSFNNVLKEAAGIFKSMQSFFGSVDIAGLSNQIKQMQQAGFTPGGMTDLGRQVQSSIMAFAPENIRNDMYSSVIQAGSAARSRGLAASVGGQAAITSYGSAYSSFGQLSEYDKSTFRTQSGLAGAITSNLTNVMANPLLMAGKGDMMTGINQILGNIDLTSPGGMRTYRKAIYGMSASTSASDQLDTLDSSVENYMSTFGLDRESAAEALLGDPVKARAYMIQKEGFARTQEKNLSLAAAMSIHSGSFASKSELSDITGQMTSMTSSVRAAGFKKFTQLGTQRQMLSHMARARAWESESVTAEHFMGGNNLFGYLPVRPQRRLERNIRYGLSDIGEEAIGTDYFGDNDFHRLGINSPGEASKMALEVSEVLEGYSMNPERMDPAISEAISEMNRSGASELMVGRLKEEMQSSGDPLRNPEEAAKLARKFGMNKVAAVLSDNRLRGQFLQQAEKDNKSFATSISRNLYGKASLDPTKSLLGSLTGNVFRAEKTKSVTRAMGGMLSNPLLSVGVAVGVGALAIGATVLTGGGALAALGAGAMVGMKAGGVMTAISLGGLGLMALADTGEGNLSKSAAKQLNESMYGTTAVVNMIVGSLPDDITSVFGRYSEFRAGERVPAARFTSDTIYGRGKAIIEGNPDISKDEFIKTVSEEALAEFAKLSSESGFIASIYNHYTSNKGILLRLIELIYSYLSSHKSPASKATISDAVASRVQTLTASPTSNIFGEGDQKVAAARRVLEKGKPGQFSDMLGRVKFESSDVKQQQQLAKSLLSAAKDTITTADGQEITGVEGAQKLMATIGAAAKKIEDDDIKGEAERNKVLTDALEGGDFKSEVGYKDIVNLFRGVSTSAETIKKMSPEIALIVQNVLENDAVKAAIKGAFPITMEPTA